MKKFLSELLLIVILAVVVASLSYAYVKSPGELFSLVKNYYHQVLPDLSPNIDRIKKSLSSAVNIDTCQTASATTTRVSVFALDTTPDQGTTTLVTCNAQSSQRLSLLFTGEASSSAKVFYDVQTSQDRITFYSASKGETHFETSTTTSQIVINPFIGNHVRVQVRANATTSIHLRLVTGEDLAR